jgi:hypothetical protein
VSVLTAVALVAGAWYLLSFLWIVIQMVTAPPIDEEAGLFFDRKGLPRRLRRRAGSTLASS